MIVVFFSPIYSRVISVISQTGPLLVNWPKRYELCVVEYVWRVLGFWTCYHAYVVFLCICFCRPLQFNLLLFQTSSTARVSSCGAHINCPPLEWQWTIIYHFARCLIISSLVWMVNSSWKLPRLYSLHLFPVVVLWNSCQLHLTALNLQGACLHLKKVTPLLCRSANPDYLCVQMVDSGLWLPLTESHRWNNSLCLESDTSPQHV